MKPDRLVAARLPRIRRIPPLWEAASLKPFVVTPTKYLPLAYSASLGGGLIEARTARRRETSTPCRRIPPLWEAASLKLPAALPGAPASGRIPPLWEAASLKLPRIRLAVETQDQRLYSASLGGGLIEAAWAWAAAPPRASWRIPPLWEAASLKRERGQRLVDPLARRIPPLWVLPIVSI